MADEKNEPIITGVGGPETAEPQAQPDNVVRDNTGQVPVQPVATSDPTINDNTNPKVFFDGADPRNIPPHDSNEQLHISAAKRFGAELTSVSTDAGVRREAVEAAYDNSKDVREVLGEGDETPDAGERLDAGSAAVQRAQAARGNRAQTPTGRAPGRSASTTGGASKSSS